jgi:hypothetical protein
MKCLVVEMNLSKGFNPVLIQPKHLAQSDRLIQILVVRQVLPNYKGMNRSEVQKMAVYDSRPPEDMERETRGTMSPNIDPQRVRSSELHVPLNNLRQTTEEVDR